MLYRDRRSKTFQIAAYYYFNDELKKKCHRPQVDIVHSAPKMIYLLVAT